MCRGSDELSGYTDTGHLTPTFSIPSEDLTSFWETRKKKTSMTVTNFMTDEATKSTSLPLRFCGYTETIRYVLKV